MLFIGIAAVVLVVLAGGVIAAHKIRKEIFGNRCESNPEVTYFEPKDFPGIVADDIAFASGGVTLRGAVYRYPDMPCRGLMIFAHGMWSGRLNYMTEIAHFAQQGLWVLGYDGTGTMDSDGDSLIGMHRSGYDLLSAIRFVEQNSALASLPRVLMGHSWGAFAVGLAVGAGAKAHCAVMLSGFNASTRTIGDLAWQQGRNLSPFLPFIYLEEVLTFGALGQKTVAAGLKNRTCPILALHGEDDGMIRVQNSIAWHVGAAAASDPPMEWAILPGKGHNVYNTPQAERALADFIAGKNRHNADFKRMTEEDSEVMDIIDGFILKYLS